MTDSEEAFLDFIERDMELHPERIRLISEGDIMKIQELVGDINDIDLSQPLSDDDE